jgi:hypothetical protein
MKVLVPSIYVMGVGGVLSLFTSGGNSPHPWGWLILIAYMVSVPFIIRHLIQLKRVFRDENMLYVSNYLTEITVPLENIATVQEQRGVKIGRKHPIILEFRTLTVFGRRVVFVPTGETLSSFAHSKYQELPPHPIFEELSTIASQNRLSAVWTFDNL